jgi:Flp pilus assembly protein TadD
LSQETATGLRELRRQPRSISHEFQRALELLESGKPRSALRKLQRAVERDPQNGEAQSALGVCLLMLGKVVEALPSLERAAALEPEEPLHRWNLAAAAKQAERLGGAYLALRGYLQLNDPSGGAEERQKDAQKFVRAYERMLQKWHPGVELGDVLRGEELFARAYAALSEGRLDEARDGFERVLELVPRHYPSWGNLGATLANLGEHDMAQKCLEQALALKPDYELARRNLEMLPS